ncbi:MAG: phospholipase D family protein [Rickettsiales bacterium]|nr:phospholipase D family protein [Rickettsiales bacterium]
MAISVLSLLMGCESRAERLPAPPQSHAIAKDTPTSLNVALAPAINAHPGESGFHVVTTGSEGFRLRLALIRAADKTLDLQYYGINDDATSNLMLEAVLRAAQRGVRIRFLLDNSTFGEVSKTLSIMDDFKNVEIRVFNPFYHPHESFATRLVTTFTELDNLGRRMHNKALIADNQMAIMGGRNLGDEYFEENADMIFKDLDILAAGPIVGHISGSFDSYWNSQNTVPVQQMKAKKASPETIQVMRKQLRDHWEEVAQTPKGKELLTSKLADDLKTAPFALQWARAELAADDPAKINKDAEDTTSRPFNTLRRMVENAEHEFVIISPYFVPRDEGVAWLAQLEQRGVQVRAITNSLASTDVVAVHVGYSPQREALLNSGVDLYEMKPIGGKRPRQRLIGKKVPAHASLHAKVFVIDTKDVMIGSFNFDPRSIELNTEITIAIHSPVIARQVMALFKEVTEPDSSYRVLTRKQAGLEGEGIVWKTTENQKTAIYEHEPKAGFWRKLQKMAFSLLPIENQL